MNKINTGGPAFPVSTRPLESEHGYGHQDGASTWQFGGMTLREYAAITLRVPQSGTDWLDDMIREARRMDAVEKAMQGLQANPREEVCMMGYVEMAEYSSKMADTLLAAREHVTQAKHDGQPENDGWIEWKGGKRPVPADTQVEVQLAEIEEIDSGVACAFAWEHRDSHFNIVAYRVLKKGSAA